jgi:hypothetical protein
MMGPQAHDRAYRHIGQRRVVDHVVGVSGTQQREEVQSALAAGGAEPGEVVVCASRRTGGWRASFVDMTHSGILSKKSGDSETASLGRAVILGTARYGPIFSDGC